MIETELKFTPFSTARNKILFRLEPEQIPFFKSNLIDREVEVFFDVGANIGFYSLYLSDIVNQVYAFEPDETAHSNFLENILLNDIHNVIVRNELVSEVDCDGIEYGTVSNASGRNSIISTSIHDKGGFNKITKMRSIKLDSEYKFTNKSIGIKIDVEGHEIYVLRGAENLLKNNEVFIQIESYNEEQTEEISEYLSNIDYKLVKIIGPDHYFAKSDTTL